MTARGLVVGAPRSGAGKTTVTLGLMAAMRRRGLRVGAVKSGPDYIDTAFHAAATGRPGLNLDTWAMPPGLVDMLAAEAAGGSDIVLAEGAMGLFDGVGRVDGRTGAASDLAARFALPVLLVVDVSGQSRSAAAVVHGFATLDPAVRVGGVVINRVASDRHHAQVAEAVERLGIPVLGALPRDAVAALPERHLGLVQAGEHADLAARLEALADMAERHLDLDAILAAAAPISPAVGAAAVLPPPGRCIALARDAAFSFVYTHVLAGWRARGAEIVSFSPLAGEPPPERCDACWLPGGYPELHAERLARATGFLDGIRRFAATRPVHGECGGHIVLGRFIEDAAGARHAMAGLLGHATSFAKRRLHLGYREARLLADCAIGPAGASVRGHEFHYASVVEPGDDTPLADIADAAGRALGPAGGARGHVSGTFFHAIAPA